MDFFYDTHHQTSRTELPVASARTLRSAPVAMLLSRWGQTGVVRARGARSAGGIDALVERWRRA